MSQLDPRRAFLGQVLRQASVRALSSVEKRIRLPSLRSTRNSSESQSPEELAGRQLSYASESGEDRRWFRPPGAIAEPEFLELCGRCNKCVDACPEHCIFPARLDGEAAPGTPVMNPNQAPCTMCGECMNVCPSGALLPVPEEFIRIGEAAIVEQSCVAWGGESCSACHDACPTTPNAIEIEADSGLYPKVSHDHCTGCGLCVGVCPTDPGSIKVRIRQVLPEDLERDRDDWET